MYILVSLTVKDCCNLTVEWIFFSKNIRPFLKELLPQDSCSECRSKLEVVKKKWISRLYVALNSCPNTLDTKIFAD